MAANITALTDAELVAAERAAHQAATAAFLEATAHGEASPAARRRVDRLTRAWEAVLDEHGRRGLLVAC